MQNNIIVKSVQTSKPNPLIGSMLGHRRPQCPNIKPTWNESLVFAGDVPALLNLVEQGPSAPLYV